MAAGGVAAAGLSGDLNLRFFLGPRQWPLPWQPPVPSGQKRKYLERYVETQPVRFSDPHPHPGACTHGAVYSGL